MSVARITRDAKGRRASIFYSEDAREDTSLDDARAAIPVFRVPTSDAYTTSQYDYFQGCALRGEVTIHSGVGSDHGGVIEDCRAVRSEWVPFGVTDWDHSATFGWSDENGHPSWLRSGMVVQRIRDWSEYEHSAAERDAALDEEGEGVEMTARDSMGAVSDLISPSATDSEESLIDNVDEPHIVVDPPPCVALLLVHRARARRRSLQLAPAASHLPHRAYPFRALAPLCTLAEQLWRVPQRTHQLRLPGLDACVRKAGRRCRAR